MSYQPTPIVDDEEELPASEPTDYAGVPQTSIQTPQYTQPPAITPPQVPANPYARNYAPQGSLTASPTQATAESLGNDENEKGIVEAQGDLAMQEGQDLFNKQMEASNEKIQNSNDYNKMLDRHTQEGEADHNKLIQSYNDYAGKAGSLKDPKNAFFDDHGGIGGRILSGFAAFASGMGAGLLGKAGNPFLDYLNQQITNNFEAHKQNIRDLYDKQVVAGKIADTDQNWNIYENKARQIAYDLASAHITNELQGIKDRATGSTQKLLADKTIADLNQQGIARREELYKTQAAQAAASLAQQRARARQVQTDYQKAIETYSKDYGPDETRQHAFRDLQALGYNRSDLASIAGGVGAKYDQKTGQFVLPELPKKEQPEDDIVPLTDPTTGKRLKPEEREKLQGLVVHLPDGTVGLANNTQDVQHIQQASNASQKIAEFNRLVEPLITKYENGTITPEEIGKWKAARGIAIAAAKGAESGSEGVSGKGTMALLGEEDFPEPPNATWASMRGGLETPTNLVHSLIAKTGATPDVYRGQLDALKKFDAENRAGIVSRLRNGYTSASQRSINKPISGKDLP